MSSRWLRGPVVYNNTTVKTTSGNVTCVNESVVVVKKDSGAATTVTLPPSPLTGQAVVVKDGKGDAATNPITVAGAAGNIDGAASHVIRDNYGFAVFVYNGTEWGATAGTTVSGAGAKNGATVTASERGNSTVHQTVLTLASTPVTVANTTGASFGGVKIYDFPAGRILVLGVTASVGFVWTDEDIAAAGSGDYSLGSTITADATLGGTDVDMLPSTAMTDPAVLGVAAATNNALAVSAQFDGTATAIDVNLNIIIDDADVADAASDVVLASGTVTISWVNLGDY